MMLFHGKNLYTAYGARTPVAMAAPWINIWRASAVIFAVMGAIVRRTWSQSTELVICIVPIPNDLRNPTIGLEECHGQNIFVYF
jgi:hypothetical protein